MIARARAAVWVLVLAACNTPVPSLQLLFAGAPSQACPSTDCGMLPMRCDAVMSIRIFEPADPTAPPLSQCIEIPALAPQNMCSLARVDLAPSPLPVRDLEVQIALYPASAVMMDPETGHRSCPTDVRYNESTGFPIDQWPTPALGGRTFYHPGDSVVSVTLGCTDLAAIDESCQTSDRIEVTATVDDFDSRASVTPDIALRLTVSVAEPRQAVVDGPYAITSADARALAPVSGGTPAWHDDVDLRFTRFVCIDVLEGVAETTSALRCRLMPSGARYDLSGVRLKKETLQNVLTALSAPAFPDQGLTIGIVIDQDGSPVAGLPVSSTAGTVQYLSGPSTIGGTATSALGIFVSRDAPFGTVFSTAGGGQPATSAIGGLVADRATVAVLQLGSQTL